MTITAYGSGARTISTASQQFKSLKDAMAQLQSQLSTGKKTQVYSGLGTQAVTSLMLNSRLSTLTGYASAIANAQTRVTLATTGTQFISKLAGELASVSTDNSVADLAKRGQAQIIAQGDMAEMVDTLNTDINGTYIFSGRATDTQPVADLDTILNGANGLKGLKDVVADRKIADLGAGLGHLATSVSGATVTLAPETPATGYGFTISGITASSSAISPATSGTPPTATMNVASQPADGDTVAITLTLPDNTTETITLKASASASTDPNAFQIGASTAATAANLKSALDAALGTAAETTLAAASTMKASTDFFSGAYPASQVVSWYRGDGGTGSARDTAVVQVGDNQSVSIGLRANETGFTNVMAAMGALAVETYTSSSDTLNVAKYNALSSRAAKLLSGPTGSEAIDEATTDLANASVTLGRASDRVAATQAQVQNTLDTTENADPTQVASELLAVQTQLQASYQTTASIAKLSLTDYL